DGDVFVRAVLQVDVEAGVVLVVRPDAAAIDGDVVEHGPRQLLGIETLDAVAVERGVGDDQVGDIAAAGGILVRVPPVFIVVEVAVVDLQVRHRCGAADLHADAVAAGGHARKLNMAHVGQVEAVVEVGEGQVRDAQRRVFHAAGAGRDGQAAAGLVRSGHGDLAHALQMDQLVQADGTG